MFFYHVGPEHGSQVIRLGYECLNPLSYLTSSQLRVFYDSVKVTHIQGKLWIAIYDLFPG